MKVGWHFISKVQVDKETKTHQEQIQAWDTPRAQGAWQV